MWQLVSAIITSILILEVHVIHPAPTMASVAVAVVYAIHVTELISSVNYASIGNAPFALITRQGRVLLENVPQAVMRMAQEHVHVTQLSPVTTMMKFASQHVIPIVIYVQLEPLETTQIVPYVTRVHLEYQLLAHISIALTIVPPSLRRLLPIVQRP